MNRVLLSSASVAFALALAACAGGPSTAAPAKPAPPAQSPPAPAAAPAKAAAEVAKPVQPAKPAAQPAKPVAEPAKPAAPAAQPAPAAKPQLMMGTTQAASSSYAYAVTAAKVINSKLADVNVTAVESGASVENINRMAQGTFHLGIATADTVYRAMQGMAPWSPDKTVKDLRVLWVWEVTAQAFVVRDDSGVRKLEDLNGKDFNPGMRGSATETLGRAALEALDIKPRLYIGGTPDAVAAIKDRRVVGFVKGTPLTTIDAAILDLATATPIRVLSFSKEQLDKVLAKHPYFTAAEIPPGVYKADWNAQPITTPATPVGFAARAATVTADQAYRMAKAIVEDNKPGGEGIQVAAWPTLKDQDIARRTVQYSLTPLHAGVQKYFTELGLQIPERLKSPEAK